MADEPYTWLSSHFLEVLHDRLLAEHGGSNGLADKSRLESALARPRNLAAYDDPDLCALAAAYASGIVNDHPFVDGNKRTGFMAAYVFLAHHGWRITGPEVDVVRVMEGLAGSEIDETTMAAWLRDHVEPR